MQTLVLDMGYQPLNAVPFSRALCYLAKGKVEVLEHYDTPIHPEWKAPAVVRLLGVIRSGNQKVKFSRQNVLARDHWKCQYCGQQFRTSDLTFDHVLPRAQGGRTAWENIVSACGPCNTRKGARTPREARMKLLKAPYRPTWLPIFSIALRDIMTVPPEWREYWQAELSP